MDLAGSGYSAMEYLVQKECEQSCPLVWQRQGSQTKVYAFISVLGHFLVQIYTYIMNRRGKYGES